MLVSSIINTCLLAISVWLFFGISRAKKWNWKTETLIFAFCFYNYHVLKFMGYCPVMTDMPTYTLSIALAYFFIKQNKTGLITTGLISIVVFPLLALMALLLLAFPNNSVGEYIPRKENAANPPSKIDKANYILNATMRAILTWWLPTAFVAYIFFRLYVRGMDNYQSVFVTRYPQNVWISVAGIIAYIIFYFYATMPLRADFATTLKQLCTRRRILAIALWLAIFVVVYTLPTTNMSISCYRCADIYRDTFSLPRNRLLVCAINVERDMPRNTHSRHRCSSHTDALACFSLGYRDTQDNMLLYIPTTDNGNLIREEGYKAIHCIPDCGNATYMLCLLVQYKH